MNKELNNFFEIVDYCETDKMEEFREK